MSDCPICTVCQYSLNDIFPLVITRCRHVFHKECILNWLNNAHNCPYCRQATTKTSLMEYALPENTPSSLNINPYAVGAIPKNTERIILSKTARKKRNDANRNLSFPPIIYTNPTLQPIVEIVEDPLQSVIENPTVSEPNEIIMSNPENSQGISQIDDGPSTSQAALEHRIANALENKFNNEFSKINDLIAKMSEQFNQVSVRSPFSSYTNPPISSILPNLNEPPPTITPRTVNFSLPTSTSTATSITYPPLNIHTNSSTLFPSNTSNYTQPTNTSFSNPILSQYSQPSMNSQNSQSTNPNFTFRSTNQNSPYPLSSTQTSNTPFSDYRAFNTSSHQSNRTSNISISSADLTHKSKIAHLVSSWNLTFAGSNTGIPVEKFIFMVNALVQDTLGGDFSVLSEHCHILFTGKAKQWFWDYRLRNSERIEWNALCHALESHYNDHLSDIDIRKLIDSRKQSNNEAFDDFYHDVLKINDRLRRKLSEIELVDLMKRNVKPYLRKELFYLHINSVSELRNLVLRREALSYELDGYASQRFGRRQVNEVDVSEQIDETIEDPSISEVRYGNVNANKKTETCFNCKMEGHKFRQCPEKLTLFCFNCGKHGYYNFNCDNCAENRQSSQGKNSSLRS